MQFSDAYNEVLETTKRPDLAGRIRREINSAISWYCLDYEHARDFTEQAIAINAQQYTQTFLLSLMTRFRKFKYLKRTGTTKFLSVVGNGELEKDCILHDRWYIAGSSVYIAMQELASSLDVGYYQYPPTLTGAAGSNDHWLLEVSPYMVIDRACAAVFKSIGDEKSMTVHRQSAGEAYIAFRRDQATAS